MMISKPSFHDLGSFFQDFGLNLNFESSPISSAQVCLRRRPCPSPSAPREYKDISMLKLSPSWPAVQQALRDVGQDDPEALHGIRNRNL